ncbi:MAG TPA: AMP-binding protein, partial [Solirubrobacterales bacterium]
MPDTGDLLWEPTAAAVEASNLTAYVDWLRAERGVDVTTYPELWRWSVDDLEAFWNSIFDRFGVEYDGERSVALASRGMPGAQWFPGVRLNWAERAFAGKAEDQVAILHSSELRELEEITWGELRERVAAVAAGLRGLGVGKGDRVVAYLPNIAEATIAFL